MDRRLSRRQITARLLATAGVGALLVYAGSAYMRGALVDHPALRPASFEDFLALSKAVLARRELDTAVARRIFDVIMDEPWGGKHISACYAALVAGLDPARIGDPSVRLALDDLDRGERWFVSHVIATWYLGVYYHEQRPTQRVTRDRALMHDAVRGLLAVPYVERMGFGSWVEPPPAQQRGER